MSLDARDRLIFALDVDSIDEAERWVRLLSPYVGMFKVGSRLFTSVGPLVIDLIHGMESSVFLDLKFHDIPAQVAGAVKEAARQRVRMLTLHALGGPKMVKAAVEEMRSLTLAPGQTPPIIAAVTMLTSHSPDEVAELGLGDPLVAQVSRLAQLATGAGADAIVASAQEIPVLRQTVPASTVFVAPGIRMVDDDHQDQSRVVTPRAAIEAGATFLVVGRPIKNAQDPVAACQRIVAEISEAST